MLYAIVEVIILNIDKVYERIQENNIEVFPYGVKNIKSISIETNNKCGIFINYNEIKDSDDEFLVATHEYGHCMTGSMHPLYSSFDVISRNEYRADRKAILDFLPIEKIKEAIKSGCHTTYEFAEYLDVPEQFIIKAFEHYNAMNLI